MSPIRGFKVLRSREVPFDLQVIRKRKRDQLNQTVHNKTVNADRKKRIKQEEKENCIVEMAEANNLQVGLNEASVAALELNPFQVAHLNNFIAAQVAFANATNYGRGTSVNRNVSVPGYNPDTMTSASFFKQMENYFTSQGVAPAHYHTRIGTILKGDKKIWYDNRATSIDSWEKFKQFFKERYDNLSIQENRKKLLWVRKQEINESVEQYVHEMVNLAKQVNKNEAENISVFRAKNGLVAELRLHIKVGDTNTLTIDSLLESAGEAMDAIRERDMHYGSYTLLPPLTGFAYREKIRHEDEHAQPSFANEELGNRNWTLGRGQSPVEHHLGYDTRTQSRMPRRDVLCFRCNEPGHIARFCNYERNDDMALVRYEERDERDLGPEEENWRR